MRIATVLLATCAASIGADGLPEAMHLIAAGDRAAFRQWFTFLAEVEYFAPKEARNPEITDCSALLRFAYREALKRHDERWAAESHLPLVLPLPPIERYSYPHTPVGALLFRTRPGSFNRSDLKDGTFREFANAEAIRRFNTYYVSRDALQAQPGDLLFFYRPGRASPAHSMIVVGKSQIERKDETVVVYHTGADSSTDGEMRRRTLTELLHYPDTQWQPRSANPYFLGVYRWVILRDSY